jgi:hypothetical protein
MGNYRPTVQVRLQLRIDEGADIDRLQASLEREPPKAQAFGLPSTQQGIQKALDSNFDRRVRLNQNRASMAREDLDRERSALDSERDRLQSARKNANTTSEVTPDAVDENKGEDDGLSVVFTVLPQQCEVERNSLKDADTCKIQLDFRDVPIDPRIVRACFVSVTMGTVGADDYEAGIRGKTRADGSLKSIVERAPGQELTLVSSTRFTGFVDEWAVSFGEDGDTVDLCCRDVSAVLRDQHTFDPKGKPVNIDLNRPIAEGVQAAIDSFVATRGIRVVFGTPVDPSDPLAVIEPDFGPIPSGIMPKTRKTKKGKQIKTPAKELNMTLWDHIVDVTVRLGLVPCLRGFTLFLLEPRVIFADLTSARAMVWGRNLKHLKFSRKMGGLKADTIEVRCPDPTIGRTRWARFPVLKGEPTSGILGKPGSPQPVTSRPSDISPNGKAAETIRTFAVRGVNDLKALERVAQSAFNEICRQEIEGEFETDDLDTFETEEEGDLLRLLPGEALQILVASPIETGGSGSAPIAEKPNTTTSNLQELTAQSAAARAQYLVGLGLSRDTAERLAAAQEKIRLVSTFRVGQMRLKWDVEDGISVSGSFFNFIVLREAPDAVSATAVPVSLTQAAKGVQVPRHPR